MTSFNAIKLNASQELQLKKARASFLGPGGPLGLDKKSGLIKQKIEAGGTIFLEPILCLFENGFGKDEFYALESLEIFLPKSAVIQVQKARGKKTDDCQKSGVDGQKSLFYFPTRAILQGRDFWGLAPCALTFEWSKDFSLEKVFLAAKDLSAAQVLPKARADDKGEDGKKALLCPTSFYLARAEISKNTWSLYDAVWKKLR